MTDDYNNLCSTISASAWKIRDFVEQIIGGKDSRGIPYSEAQLADMRAEIKKQANQIDEAKAKLFNPIEDKQTIMEDVVEEVDGESVTTKVPKEVTIPLTAKQVLLKEVGTELAEEEAQ